MKNILPLALVLTSVFPSAVLAAPFYKECPDIPTCAKAVSRLTGQSYIFDAEVKGKIFATEQLELTAENAEVLFTKALDFSNYARVLVSQNGGKPVYQIMRQRDARDSALPIITADSKTAPVLPDTWDLVTMSYQAAHPEGVEYLARTSRSFMPANSRIIPMETSGRLLITDSVANLRKIYEIIRSNDVKISPEVLKEWKEWSEQRMALEIAERSACTGKKKPSDD